MLLAIDVGNTNIVIGCMDGETIEFTERLSTDAGKTSLEYAILFKTALDIHHVDTSRTHHGSTAQLSLLSSRR